jgi:YD repeat-containing protein
MAYYFIETFSYKLNSIYTKNYIDPVPLNQNVVYFSGAEQDFTENYELHDINFKKITSTQTFEYGALKGLPTKVITDTSKGDFNSTVNTYVNQASTLTGLSEPQTTAFNNLLASNRVASPIEVKQFRNTEMLSKQRTVFKLDSYNHVLPESIQTAKGTNPLEVKAIFEEYDQRGNPTLVLLKDGTKTKYFYNSNNQVVAKIENFTGNATNIPSDPCQMITNFSNSLLTLYTYDTTTQLLTQITDTNCRKTTYVYDELLRLKQIIDHDGNVIKEFDNNYRPN